MQTNPTPQTECTTGKYAKFSLFVQWTYLVAKKKQKPTKTFRDDLVTINYENDGMKVEGLHPVHLLHRMFLELKMQAYCAIIYDNSKQGREAVVFKAIMNEGQTMIHPDRRAEYFDLESGMSFDFLNPLNKKLVA